MTELEPRGVRHEIASREYQGRESLEGAFADRQKMSAAVEAAKRAHVDETQWMWTAREAERTLGRMILEAREAGDLYDQDHRASSDVTLDDLGISRNLAAYAVKLAGVPAELWAQWHESETPPTRAAVERTTQEWARQADAAKDREAEAQRRAREAKRQAKEAQDRYTKMRQQDVVSQVPPLTEEETQLVGAQLALDVAVAAADPEGPKVDQSTEVKGQALMVSSISNLAQRIESHDPCISQDAFLDVNVMAARDAVRRLTDAAAVWLRTLNALYLDKGSNDT